jgi:putative peptidoglycan lipid II flippase
VLVIFLAPFFIFLFAPGFYLDETKKDIAIISLKIMFPYLALISLVAFAAGIQNTHSRFSLPAATPIIFNLTLIIFALLIAPRMNTPLISLSWGVFLAGVLQLIIQFAPLKAIDRLPVPKVNLNNSDIPRFFKLIVPAVLAGGVTQINLLIDTIFASLLETGSPTWLYISDTRADFCRWRTLH